MRSLNLFLLVVVICVTVNVQAAFVEDFDTFISGVLVAQENWEANAGFNVVAAGAGKAIKSNTYTDKTTRHDANGVDFGLAMDQDGIEYGFDFMEETSTLVNMRMYLRKQRLAVYSPSFGLSAGVVSIRPAGESGTTISGTNFAGSDIYGDGSAGDPGYWVKGEWLQFKIILTGAGFDTATVKAYNLSRGGLEIPTGLTGISLGVNPKFHAGWTGFNLRGGTTGTNIDNAYVTDYTAPPPPAPATYVEDFEAPLTLGSIDQAGWRDNAPAVTVVSTTSSGEYVGGQGMLAGSTSDEWPQYDTARSEDFGLQVGVFDGVEMGFDFMDSYTTLPYCRVHFREGLAGSSSPAIGLQGGAFAIRSLGEGGDMYTGSTLGDALNTGLYAKGDWVTIRLVMRGSLYNTATLYAYNMTKSVDIPTGIVNIDLGTDPQLNAQSWDRLVFRMNGSTGTTVDNAYISDYVNTNVVAEVVSPTDGEYPVGLENIELEWISVAGVDLHKVYFSTEPDANDFELDTTNTSYVLPYTLEEGTTYYWRIDEVIDGVVNTGDVWSFTTALGELGLPRIMAYEGFDYDAYIDLKAAGNGTGGFGWATGWERVAGEYCYVEVGSGSLDPGMDYPYGTIGNKIQHSNNASGNDAMRKLEYPIDLRADQDYYISYLAMGDADTFNSILFRVLEGKSGGSSFGVDMFYDGYPNVTTPTVYVRDFDGVWVSNPVAGWSGGVVSVIVVKIEAYAASDDVVSVCVYDAANPMPETEPAVWQQSVSADKNTIYEWIQFSGRSDGFDQWHVDEIHVGTGWGAVTGWVEACGDLGTIMDYDLNEDCVIDFGDFAVLASGWLDCTNPVGTGCVWALDADDPNVTTLFTDLDASELNVYEVRSTVTVDGDLSEWDGVRWYNTRFTTGYETGNAADVTEAQMALTWDSTTPEVVYVAVKVTDTDPNLTDTPTEWNSGDNLEVRFSVNETSTDTFWYSNETFDVAQFYQVFHKASGGTWCSLGSIGQSTDDPATDDIDVAYATSVDGDLIIYEMALPTYSVFNLGAGTGTKLTLSDGDVIAFNLQINSVSASGSGGLYHDQAYAPASWFDFRVTANSSLALGDMGFFDADLDSNGEVGLTDLRTIALKWLSCTDPEIEGCDTPWAP